MDKDLLFIFGPARGGTTFLNQIMEEWFDVGTGPEGTFIPEAVTIAKKLGDLSDPVNRQAFGEYLSKVEMLEIIRKRYPAEESFDVTTQNILSRMHGDSPADGIFAVFQAVADYSNHSNVGNKNPGYWRHLDLLYKLFQKNSKYLCIVRDGRDVALSLKNISWGGHSCYEAALNWKNMIHSIENFKQLIVPDRLLVIRYEDLLQNPGNTIRKIAQFMNSENIEDLVLRYERIASHNSLKSNFYKWRSDMPPRDVRDFEAVAGNELSLYGYECLYTNPEISFFRKLLLDTARFYRLLKLNIFFYGRTLPTDQKKWLTGISGKIKTIFIPGSYRARK